jgi:hypothetical protein
LWSQLVARAWCDGALLERLLSDPRGVLAEHGMEVPEGTGVEVTEGDDVTVVEGADAVLHFTLPLTPPDDLADEELLGGTGVQFWCGACGACGRCGGCGCRCSCRCAC